MTFTDKAKNYIKSIRPSDRFLRIKIVGDGCSGLSYVMEFVDSYNVPNDEVTTEDGFVCVVDKKSAIFLKDVEVDYSDGFNGTGFVYNNPNAKRTCGCGSSFNS